MKGSSVSRSRRLPGRRQSCCTAAYEYTLPVGRTATILVFSLNGLKSTGHWYLPSASLWKWRRVSSLAESGSPVSGCCRNFFRNGTMLSRSNTAPSGAQNGSSNGVSEMAQQSNGSRFTRVAARSDLFPPHSTAHSLAVMCIGAFECWFFPIALAAPSRRSSRWRWRPRT